MIASPDGCLYMATEGRGLLDYNLGNRQYAYYPIDNASKLQYSQNIIKGLLLEGDVLWCGTNKELSITSTPYKKYTLYYQLPRICPFTPCFATRITVCGLSLPIHVWVSCVCRIRKRYNSFSGQWRERYLPVCQFALYPEVTGWSDADWQPQRWFDKV